jgi:DNA polymerase-3 subunit gamma/tau
MAAEGSVSRALAVWASEVLPALKPFVKALYAGAKVLGEREGGLGLAFPNEAHRAKSDGHRRDVEAVLARVAGGPVRLVLVVDHEAVGDDNVVHLQRSSPRSAAPAPEPEPEEHIDLSELVDVPPESVVGPLDRLAQAFPGSQLLDETP